MKYLLKPILVSILNFWGLLDEQLWMVEDDIELPAGF